MAINACSSAIRWSDDDLFNLGKFEQVVFVNGMLASNKLFRSYGRCCCQRFFLKMNCVRYRYVTFCPRRQLHRLRPHILALNPLLMLSRLNTRPSEHRPTVALICNQMDTGQSGYTYRTFHLYSDGQWTIQTCI